MERGTYWDWSTFSCKWILWRFLFSNNYKYLARNTEPVLCEWHVISAWWSMTVLFTPLTGCPSHVPWWHEKCTLAHDPGFKNMSWGPVKSCHNSIRHPCLSPVTFFLAWHSVVIFVSVWFHYTARCGWSKMFLIERPSPPSKHSFTCKEIWTTIIIRQSANSHGTNLLCEQNTNWAPNISSVRILFT